MVNNEERILAYFKQLKEPVSEKEIEESLGLSSKEAKRDLKQLEEREIVSRVGNPRYSMWNLTENNGGLTYDEYNQIKSFFNSSIADTKGAATELQEKVDLVEQKINGIYVNFISLMGIFVTVFSVVVTNAQRVYDYSQLNTCIKDFVIGMLASNGATITVIFFLLWFIKSFFSVEKK